LFVDKILFNFVEINDFMKEKKDLKKKNPIKKDFKDKKSKEQKVKEQIDKEKNDKKEDYHQRIRIKIKAFDHKIIDKAIRMILDVVEKLNVKIIGPIPLPIEKSKYTVLRSTFVHKDARDQFEMRVHKRLIDIIDPTSKVVEALTNLNLPAGVDVEIKM
jgi:small subunit ribosomal protein S10